MDERLEAGNVPADKVGTNDEGEPEVTEPLLAAGTFPNDNEIVKRVEGSEDGIGFFGYAYYSENKGDLKAVGIENPDTGKCVKPTAKTIRGGTYPISRTLFIYPNNAQLSENTTFKDFMDFYMTKKNLTDTVEQAGYVSLAPADITSSIERLQGHRRLTSASRATRAVGPTPPGPTALSPSCGRLTVRRGRLQA